VILFVALAKVEGITGHAPTLAIIKGEQKPPALTADALNLSHDILEPQAVVEVMTEPIQPVCQFGQCFL